MLLVNQLLIRLTKTTFFKHENQHHSMKPLTWYEFSLEFVFIRRRPHTEFSWKRISRCSTSMSIISSGFLARRRIAMETVMDATRKVAEALRGRYTLLLSWCKKPSPDVPRRSRMLRESKNNGHDNVFTPNKASAVVKKRYALATLHRVQQML